MRTGHIDLYDRTWLIPFDRTESFFRKYPLTSKPAAYAAGDQRRQQMSDSRYWLRRRQSLFLKTCLQAADDHLGHCLGIHCEFLSGNGVSEPVDDEPVDGELDELCSINRTDGL